VQPPRSKNDMQKFLGKLNYLRRFIFNLSEKIGAFTHIPQMLTMDQGSSFMSHQVREFAESLKIKLFSFSPYYAQVNGHAESSNKTLIKLIRKIEENP
jgi:transposase InsO family protein